VGTKVANEKVTEEAGAASKQAAATLQATTENFRTEQRPWIVFSMIPTSPINWKGADQWGLDFNFSINIQNFGKTPATDVTVSQPRAIISDDAGISANSDLLNQACTSVMQGKRVPGHVIYPGHPIRPVERRAWIPGSHVKKESARHSGLTILVAVCISYRPTYKVDKPYRYGQVYSIGDKASGALTDLFIGKGVATENIVLEPDAFSSPIID